MPPDFLFLKLAHKFSVEIIPMKKQKIEIETKTNIELRGSFKETKKIGARTVYESIEDDLFVSPTATKLEPGKLIKKNSRLVLYTIFLFKIYIYRNEMQQRENGHQGERKSETPV